jgi:hypothetical protein
MRVEVGCAEILASAAIDRAGREDRPKGHLPPTVSLVKAEGPNM